MLTPAQSLHIFRPANASFLERANVSCANLDAFQVYRRLRLFYRDYWLHALSARRLFNDGSNLPLSSCRQQIRNLEDFPIHPVHLALAVPLSALFSPTASATSNAGCILLPFMENYGASAGFSIQCNSSH